MDTDRHAALATICADYRAEFVAPKLDVDWTDTEEANRGFVSIGLAGGDSFIFGADRIRDQLDALCRVASVERVINLTDSRLYEEVAPRILGMVCPYSEAELLLRLRWLVGAIGERDGDISTLWREEPTDRSFGILAYLYKDSVPASVLLRLVTGKPVMVFPSSDATVAACRIGLVSWTDSLLHIDGSAMALRKILAAYEDKHAGDALEWFSQVQCCSAPSSPRCESCRIFNECEALSLGLV